MLQDAEELAGMGSWEFDLVTRERWWSEGLIRIMEVNLDSEPRGGDHFWNRVHPDDSVILRGLVDRAVTQRAPFMAEFRALLPSGRRSIFAARGRAIYNEAGQPTRMIGVTWDITEQREREERLRKREALLEQAERVANMGTWHHDFASDKVYASEDLLKVYGLKSYEEWEQKLHWSRFDPEDHQQAIRNMQRAKQECGTYDVILRYHHPDSGLRILNLRCVSLPARNGKPAYAIGITQDVTKHTERDEGLRRNQALLSHAERIANFGSWQTDFATGKTFFSKHALEIFGLESQEEWDAETCWQRVDPEDRKTREAMKQAWAEGKSFNYTTRYRRPDGEDRVLHTRGLTLADASGTPARAIGVIHDVTEQLRAEEELRRLSRQLMQTRDSERRRLARELHESAGQSLAALKMTLGRVRDHLPEDAVLHLLLASAAELADEAIREVRTVSYVIHPPLLDEAGLGLALRLYLKGFSERSGIQTSLEGGGDFGRAAQESETTLFRVVQESLTNVHRHSGSRTALVRLRREDGKLIAEIADKGRGLPHADRAAGHGVGIAGMLERVKHLNGSLEIDSRPGKGTTIRVALPDSDFESAMIRQVEQTFQPSAEPREPRPLPGKAKQEDAEEVQTGRPGRRAVAK
jgi:PAS domain S-box-containing protein